MYYSIDFDEIDAAASEATSQQCLLRWLQPKQLSCDALATKHKQYESSVVPRTHGGVVLVVDRRDNTVGCRKFYSPDADSSQVVMLDERNCVKFSVAVTMPYSNHADKLNIILPSVGVKMKKVALSPQICMSICATCV